jgi:D-3-phosphoglycerate dehydrogenase
MNAEPDGYSVAARDVLSAFADVREVTARRQELLTALGGADGLIVRLGHRVDEELLAAAPRLRMVATATTGLNHIDLKAAARHGVTVLSLKGETAFLDTVTATAEHTWGLLLALVRHLPGALTQAMAGRWERDQFKGRELSGLTLGIVGYGRLGRMVAGYGRAFRMRILAADPSPISQDAGISYLPLPAVLAGADVVSVHVALNPETDGLLDTTAFAQMKSGTYLVNTSRGEILDECALLKALESGRLAGAALDVLRDEVASGQTMPANHPLLTYARTHDNLLITPHIGGATTDAMHKTEVFLANKIRCFYCGEHENDYST